jgi:hypothetical protein
MIDQKYLFSFAGIILGWGLNQISGLSSRSIDRRQRLGTAIASLKAYHREARLLRSNREFWKEKVSSWEEFERRRQHISKRLSVHKSYLTHSIPETLSTIAILDPVCAEELDSCITQLEYHNKIQLTHSSAHEDLYIRQLSILEVGVDLCIKGCEKALLRLSRNHSFRTWIHIVCYLNRTKKK